eukprot:6119361-Ditylum_brightwellii.AAC.1
MQRMAHIAALAHFLRSSWLAGCPARMKSSTYTSRRLAAVRASSTSSSGVKKASSGVGGCGMSCWTRSSMMIFAVPVASQKKAADWSHPIWRADGITMRMG